jgi:hypothetical protein
MRETHVLRLLCGIGLGGAIPNVMASILLRADEVIE